MPNIDRKPVIRNFYIKQSSDNSSSVYGHPIGVESCYSKLNPVTTYNISNNPSATASTTSYRPVYEDNVQAEMIRKGYQVNYLRNRLQGAISYMQTVSDQADELEERVDGLEDKTIYDSDVNLTGNSTEGSKKAILDGTSAQNVETIPTLAAAIPYITQADYQNANSTITAYNGDSPLILGADGLYNIGRKFNALTNRVQSLENSYISDSELIERYYKNQQHYVIYNSNIDSELGTMVNNKPDGHMKYIVYQGKGTNGTNTTFSDTLMDVDKLPTPPEGYVWSCVYCRGTYPSPISTYEGTDQGKWYYYQEGSGAGDSWGTLANKNVAVIWTKQDGYATYNGYASGATADNNYISFDYNVPDLYKGTNFSNFYGFCQATNHWKAAIGSTISSNYLMMKSNGSALDFDTISTDAQAKAALNDLHYKFIIMYGNQKRRYIYQRIRGSRRLYGPSSSTSGQSGYKSSKTLALQRLGNKFNQLEKVRIELALGANTAAAHLESFFVPVEGVKTSTLVPDSTPIAISLRNFPLTLMYNNPFMYAEYVLVPTSQRPSKTYWYDTNTSDMYEPQTDDSSNS